MQADLIDTRRKRRILRASNKARVQVKPWLLPNYYPSGFSQEALENYKRNKGNKVKRQINNEVKKEPVLINIEKEQKREKRKIRNKRYELAEVLFRQGVSFKEIENKTGYSLKVLKNRFLFNNKKKTGRKSKLIRIK